MLKLLNMHFEMLEYYGQSNVQDLIAIIYLMFIDEYYDYYRAISFNDIDNNEIGLTDCMVKNLNAMIDCLKKRTNLLSCTEISELPTKLHWVIPDIPVEDYEVVNNVLIVEDTYVLDNMLYIGNYIVDENTLML